MPIKLKNVCKSFDGQCILRDLNLTLSDGKAVCISGRSGLGKTTLLRMLMGLDKPDSGAIEGLDGLKVSAVFQEDRLCEALSASANAAIALKKGESRAFSDGLLREMGLEEDLMKPVSAMSGGMRRRVSIARALSAEYDLLLLDEPFTGLDEKTRRAAIRCIMTHARGKTTVIVSHDGDIPAIFGCDTVDLEALMPPRM
ncbi:MAG: ATP-binding cassette domain-containing protein [Clostridiales bacterium]|nr:ATP-binding cassette domain-containing protein [Clostridiales bacterium]